MKSLDGVNKKNDVNNTASEAPEKNVKTESEKIDFSKVKIEPLFEEMVDFDTFSKSDFRAALQHQGCSGRFPDDSVCMAL